MSDHVWVLTGWVAVALLGSLALTQAIGFDRLRVVSIVQTFTPFALALAAPIAIVAVLAGETAMAVVAAAIVFALVVLAVPLVRRRRTPTGTTPGGSIRILHANLLSDNHDGIAIAGEMTAIDADVVALTEYTFHHAEAFGANGFAERYAHQAAIPHTGPPGIALWSRVPFRLRDAPPTRLPWIDLVLEGEESASMRVLVVHTSTPVFDHDAWRAELALLGDVVSSTALPTVVVGDFNATWWHPGFRRLLRDAHLRSAHVDVGRGWSASWPTDRRWLRRFARLDHALVDRNVTILGVVDIPVAGSDHRGFVISVRSAR